MKPEVLKIIKKLIQKYARTTFLIAVLSFCAVMLTWLFYPSKLQDVGMLCLISFVFMFGATMGLSVAWDIIRRIS